MLPLERGLTPQVNLECNPKIHDATGDEHGTAAVDGGSARRAAAGDGHGAATVDGGAARRAAAGDVHTAIVIDGSVVRRAAAGDEHGAAAVDGGLQGGAENLHGIIFDDAAAAGDTAFDDDGHIPSLLLM